MVKRTPVTKINENKKITFGYSSIMSYEVFPPKKDKIHERKFDVNTTSGNKYTVTINKLVNCTCPDFQRGASRCKHICFIMDNVLHESFQEFIIIIKLWIICSNIYQEIFPMFVNN